MKDYRALARERFAGRDRRRGFLIAFEGPDGSGKTTQRKLFKTWLRSEGHDVVTTYAVCHACHERQDYEGKPLTLKCTRCGRVSEVDWSETC